MPVEAQIHPHIAEEMAHLFTAHSADIPEDEFNHLGYRLWDACKPSLALFLAPKEIMVGRLGQCLWSPTLIDADLSRSFGFVFLDNLPLPQRADDLATLIERDLLTPRAVVAIHDTSRCRTLKDGTLDPEAAEFWARMERLVIRKHKPRAVLELPLSRGLTLIQV